MNEENGKICNEWKSYLEDRGVGPDKISAYLAYITTLQENNVPVIFELQHLSNLLGIEYTVLCKMVNSPQSFYREFTIPKKRGGKRILNAPYPSLLYCQSWIYNNILLQKRVHRCAQGFVHNRSILTNASQHLNKKVILKMDLEDFFPSVPINWVINYFNSLGYAENVSFYLASLCCHKGALPQGASTSPCLSNILLFHLDQRIEKLSRKYNLTYTRYADDLTFSGGYIPHRFSEIITDVVSSYNLRVNLDKTKLLTKAGQRIVTGISVAGEILKLPRRTKRNLRREIHFIRKYGLLSHMSKMKIQNVNYLESLEGKFGFWLQVEPCNDFAKDSILYIQSLKQM